jgi:tetratricopeptide (TPR) repeat protein
LYAGNVEGYRKTCARMLDHFVRIGRERHDNSFGATSACWACVLAPDAVEDFASAIKLAEAGLIKPYRNDQDHLNLGAILYRAGQFEEAIDKLKELVTTWEKSGLLPNTMSPASAWFFLAMAHHQLGQHEEAEKWLAKANERVELELAGDPRFWARPLVLELLQAEARLLLGASEQQSPTGTSNCQQTLPKTRGFARRSAKGR